MSNTRQFRLIPAVYIAVLKGEEVLMIRRKNTGFMDGYYDLPSGHLEPLETLVEAAVRELKEESGIEVAPKSLELFNVVQGYSNANENRPYIYFFFKTNKFNGSPRLTEPDLSDDIDFFKLDSLPKVIPHVAEALRSVKSGKVSLGYVRPGQYD